MNSYYLQHLTGKIGRLWKLKTLSWEFLEACGAPTRGALEAVGTGLVAHAAGARAWSFQEEADF